MIRASAPKEFQNKAQGRPRRGRTLDRRTVTTHDTPKRLQNGFTLLEVIIALSLTLILLSAVYGAIQLQYRLSTTGREEMLRAQVVREVLGQIEADIRAVVWQVQKPAASDSESESSESSGDSGSGQAITDADSAGDTAEMLTTDDAFTGGSSGIFGDAQSLVVHISRPARSLVYASSDEEGTGTDPGNRSDLASVNYFMADATAGGLSAAVAQQNGGGSSILGGVVGLARLENDRLTIEQAGAEGAAMEELAIAGESLVVPEIVSIEFAYWDGVEWLDSWDSLVSGTLPAAIGITLEVDATTVAGDRTRSNILALNSPSDDEEETGSPVVVQYVVAVPLAEPNVGEASF